MPAAAGAGSSPETCQLYGHPSAAHPLWRDADPAALLPLWRQAWSERRHGSGKVAALEVSMGIATTRCFDAAWAMPVQTAVLR